LCPFAQYGAQAGSFRKLRDSRPEPGRTDTLRRLNRTEYQNAIRDFLALELAMVGQCDNGYACVYPNNLSWSSPTPPLPAEAHPRIVVERLFGEGGSAADRRAALKKRASLLDAVSEEITRLKNQLGPADRTQVSQYLDTVREVERRIQKAEADAKDNALPELDRPMAVPAAYTPGIASLSCRSRATPAGGGGRRIKSESRHAGRFRADHPPLAPPSQGGESAPAFEQLVFPGTPPFGPPFARGGKRSGPCRVLLFSVGRASVPAVVWRLAVLQRRWFLSPASRQRRAAMRRLRIRPRSLIGPVSALSSTGTRV